ncbi:hypothetical protein MRX96_053717, partial [Rhipicephalus microplus]
LRGVVRNSESNNLEPLLVSLYLKPYKETLLCQLSPHFKRAVCAAIVFSAYANFSLVILAEPSRQMDPRGQNHVWETLAQMAEVSSVLVTTTSIQEAEMIADRLIVMREGRVVCDGSPTENDVKRAVQHYMGPVEPRRVTKLDMVFNLSERPEKTQQMTTMLQYLEKRRSLLGIAVMTLSYCTLEDIYIK